VLRRAARILIMGGAVFCAGNVTPHAEFNFYRDPAAAAAVLSSGLPITVVPLDVTRQVALDVSHIAHLTRSGSRAAELLARMTNYPIENHNEAGPRRFLVHDAMTIGLLLWPQLFTQARMGLDVITSGPQAGKCKPTMPRDKSRQVNVVMSVSVVDFLENMLELLCRERFVV
jgi:purine nucleosidase